MKTNAIFLIAALTAAACAGGSFLQADDDNPFALYEKNKRAEQNEPKQQYPLAESNGPWMVRVLSLSGEYKLDDFHQISARELANEVAKELRETYKIDAYTYRFQLQLFNDEAFNEFKKQFKAKYKVAPKVPRQRKPPENWVVLAGNLDTIDDDRLLRKGEATRLLAKIKEINPKSIPDRVRAQLRFQLDPKMTPEQRRLAQQAAEAGQFPHPFSDAMLTRNPLVKSDPLPPITPEMAKMLHSLNDESEYSVYKLDAVRFPYTIQVATFNGVSVFDGKKHNERAVTDKGNLSQAGHNAEIVCEQLRKMGYKSYVFHGKYGSMVCIGGYRSLDDPNIQNDVKALRNVKVGDFPLTPQEMITPRRPN